MDNILLEVGAQQLAPWLTMISSAIFIAATSVFLVSIWTCVVKRPPSSSPPAARLPPGPWALPLVGNLHQMALGSSLPHRRLRDLARQYGPVMRLRFGEVPIVVVSSAEWAKLFLQAHDASFAARPLLPAASIVFYGGRDIAFAAYGEYWRKMRKVCDVGLLGTGRVKSLYPVMEQEVCKWIHASISRTDNAGISSKSDESGDPALYSLPPPPAGADHEPINLSRSLFDLGCSINSRLVLGMSSLGQEEVGVFFSLAGQLMKAMGGFDLVDLFPSSELLRRITGAHGELKKLHAALDAILETVINDHVTKRSAAKNIDDEEEEEDLVDFLLNLKENNEHRQSPITNSDIKAVILDLLMAGTSPWIAVVEWAMSELMKHPRMMEKAQKEVRHRFDGQGEIVDEAGINELQYLELVLTETLRFHSPGPLNLPRENQETVVINGYQIPAKTKVIFNSWAMGRDPDHWTNPECFDPERFLHTSTDYKGHHFDLIPFGAGRRICPGMHFGTTIVKLVLANLLYRFDWELPNQMKPPDLDMSERLGLDLRRKNDLVLVPIPYHHESIEVA
ncbi:unnamed protein product [Linum trigynum]|uniref:Cytochrome P450 n=1 Tax=Linum trigynum TaxID=586398 RepID=A0AAV2EL20_9ROSI